MRERRGIARRKRKKWFESRTVRIERSRERRRERKRKKDRGCKPRKRSDQRVYDIDSNTEKVNATPFICKLNCICEIERVRCIDLLRDLNCYCAYC